MQVHRLPNAWLLFALLLLVAVYPFLEDVPFGRAMIAFFDPAILGLALVAARASGAEGKIGMVLVAPAIVLHIVGAAVYVILGASSSQRASGGNGPAGTRAAGRLVVLCGLLGWAVSAMNDVVLSPAG